jgi:hypothetical protein
MRKPAFMQPCLSALASLQFPFLVALKWGPL